MKKYLMLLVILVPATCIAQENTNDLPYREIRKYDEPYTATTVAARMIDGLGFRFYWATEGLRPEDLKFKPNEEARTSSQTIDHIYELTVIINNTVLEVNNGLKEGLTFEEKRADILHMLKAASDRLLNSKPEDLTDFKIRFGNGVEFPFWNLLNGPIEDAVWHCGQIVSFRRSSGNPFSSKVSVLQGTVRE